MKKWNFFGYQFEWYDIKTKAKKILRGITYSSLVQIIICRLIIGYMWLVYFSCKKKIVNQQEILDKAKHNQPLIVVFWHNRLMMTPFIARFINKFYPEYKFISLASNHGDGQFVGRVMSAFGFQTIYGSSQQGRKKSRGIDLHSLREILRGLKSGKVLGITPDGPRGPNQKINSEIITMAKISGTQILPMSCASSNYKKFNSWDQFKLALPFGNLCFYFGELITVKKDLTEEEEMAMRLELERLMNDAQDQADRIASASSM